MGWRRLRVRNAALDELVSCSGLTPIAPVTWAALDHQLCYSVVDATDRCVESLLDLASPIAPLDWSDVHPLNVRGVVEQPTSPALRTPVASDPAPATRAPVITSMLRSA
jgi:hypothetical protein